MRLESVLSSIHAPRERCPRLHRAMRWLPSERLCFVPKKQPDVPEAGIPANPSGFVSVQAVLVQGAPSPIIHPRTTKYCHPSQKP